MNFFHFGGKSQQELSIEELQISEKNQIWHKCSEHKHYNGLPMEPPLLVGEVYKKGEYDLFKKHLSMMLYSDKMIFFKINSGKEVNSHPHAIIFFEVSLKVQWNFAKEKKEENKGHKDKLVGFKLSKSTNYIEFFSDSTEFLELLKQKNSAALFSLNFYDDFRIIKPIGKGTSAIVFLSENIQSNERFAVKACQKSYLYQRPDWRDILDNEINCLRAFDHPNLIKLHGLYETDNAYCLVFDALQGGNLADYLKKFPKGLKDNQCFSMMKGILSGLREMHSKRIMHRDIKPENILFREKNAYSDENNICIADFGLATTQNVQKYLFFRCGTPGYIAPEVLNITDPYEKYSEKCDVFSAGAIMFQLLTGIKAFPGEECNRVVMMNRKAHVDFNVLKKLNVGEEAIDVLKKMLTREAINRISAEDALLHPYFNSNRLKLSMEEEEFSLELNEIDRNIEKNVPSFKGKFDFSCKNYSIFGQCDAKDVKDTKEVSSIEDVEFNPCFVRESVMNGNLDTLRNVSLHEFGTFAREFIEKKPSEFNSMK